MNKESVNHMEEYNLIDGRYFFELSLRKSSLYSYSEIHCKLKKRTLKTYDRVRLNFVKLKLINKGFLPRLNKVQGKIKSTKKSILVLSKNFIIVPYSRTPSQIKKYLDRGGFVTLCVIFILMVFPNQSEIRLLLKGSLRSYRVISYVVSDPHKRRKGAVLCVGLNSICLLLEQFVPNFCGEKMVEIEYGLKAVRMVGSVYLTTAYKLLSYGIPTGLKELASPLIDFMAETPVAVGLSTIPLLPLREQYLVSKSSFLKTLAENGRLQELMEKDIWFWSKLRQSLQESRTGPAVLDHYVKESLYCKVFDNLNGNIENCIKSTNWIQQLCDENKLNPCVPTNIVYRSEVFNKIFGDLEKFQSVEFESTGSFHVVKQLVIENVSGDR
jgi:hypothetical protein